VLSRSSNEGSSSQNLDFRMFHNSIASTNDIMDHFQVDPCKVGYHRVYITAAVCAV
jgi:hypothetical protein